MIAAVCLTVAVSGLFYLVSGIDLAVAHLFFEPGSGFPASRIEALNSFRTFASNVSLTLPLVLVVTLALKLAYPSKPSLLPPRLSLFFIALFLAGPALLVNGILKPFWGRPRPINVVDFGGPWVFEKPWVIGMQGLGNHSFSSGEAATTACLLPLILFVPREWRWQIGAPLAIFVAAVSLNRIAFGAHFLSDVVISIGLMLVLAAVLRHLFFVRYREVLSDAALEERLTALGLRMADDRAAFGRRLGESFARVRDAISRRGAAPRAAGEPSLTDLADAADRPSSPSSSASPGGAAVALGHAAPNGS
ncbi:phosphatase PAP2 family protein [Ancylobacter sp.]|uniref:phosphatase PAP2 family protein n=1 Tax=Ancylobacter sp. TaxID=1872567 RepID=UPI003D0FA129